MKKFLPAALAISMAAFSATAESYTCDPALSNVIDAGARQVYYIVLSDNAVATLQQANIEVTNVGPNENEGRNLYYWNGLVSGDTSMPRVDFDEGEYISVQVTGDGGWSGAGVNIAATNSVNLSTFTDDTHFHLAYMTPNGNAPASVGMIILDGAKFALGDAYNDNGTIYPSVAPKATDEWQAIDITIGQMKQIFPGFAPANLVDWSGNIMSWLAGGVAGQTIAFDAVYFYNTTENQEQEVPDYTCDPSITEVLKNEVSTVNHIVLSDAAVAQFKSAGATCNYVGPDSNSGRNLYFWNGFTNADTSTPRVDQEEGSYISVSVTADAGWSGAGINIADANPVDLSTITDETHFHLAYMTPTGSAPASVGLIIMGSGKIALGESFNDNGTIYPSVAPAATDQWQGIDITVKQLKDLCPSFNLYNLSSWSGDILAWLAGSVANTSIAFDAVYFYNIGEVTPVESPEFICDPTTSRVIEAGADEVDYVVLADNAVAELRNAGATCTYVGPDANNGRNLYFWNGFVDGDTSYPRVDQEEGSYVSLTVTEDAGWSGAGFNIAETNPVDLSNISDETHFHVAYMTPNGNAPASIALNILETAHIALGNAFNDNGTVYTSVAPKATTEWQGVDITLGQIKELNPFTISADMSSWSGNILSILAGGVADTSFALDAVYFYNIGSSSIATVKAETESLLLTGKTINLIGGNGIELYNLAGQMVKSTNGSTLGIENLPNGVYVAKTRNAVKKVVVK